MEMCASSSVLHTLNRIRALGAVVRCECPYLVRSLMFEYLHTRTLDCKLDAVCSAFARAIGPPLYLQYLHKAAMKLRFVFGYNFDCKYLTAINKDGERSSSFV